MAHSTMGGRGGLGSHLRHHHSMDPNGGNGGAVFGDIVVYVQVGGRLSWMGVSGLVGRFVHANNKRLTLPRLTHTTTHHDRR